MLVKLASGLRYAYGHTLGRPASAGLKFLSPPNRSCQTNRMPTTRERPGAHC